MYDFYLDGKDNFVADREAAQRMIERIPQIPAAAKGNRQFLQRAVTAVAESGVKQFIDIGSGLPTMENTHQVAHAIDPAVKVAYVDRDPQVISHARAILEDGGTRDNVLTLDGELRESAVLPQLLSPFIDWSQPVALMLVAVMHFIEPPEAYRVVDAYKEKMAPGSYLILSHSTADYLSEEEATVIEEEYGNSNAEIYLRGIDEVETFFRGTELLDPGIVNVEDWRAGEHVPQTTMVYGAVGKKAAA
jgi:O-methyltransferase involved in polyketide biosynthesis